MISADIPTVVEDDFEFLGEQIQNKRRVSKRFSGQVWAGNTNISIFVINDFHVCQFFWGVWIFIILLKGVMVIYSTCTLVERGMQN